MKNSFWFICMYWGNSSLKGSFKVTMSLLIDWKHTLTWKVFFFNKMIISKYKRSDIGEGSDVKPKIKKKKLPSMQRLYW